MILGLNGLKGSGKDTVAAYLIKEHGFERRAFADPLKKSIAAFFDIPFHKVDEYKNDPHMRIELRKYSSLEDSVQVLKGSGMSFREGLQRYGTESHRDVFGEDFWVDMTLPADAFYTGRKIAITDLRFENETQRVRDVGGFVVNIWRPGLDDTDQHSSESSLPDNMIDYYLVNDGTLDDLNERVERMLTDLGTNLSRGEITRNY